MLTHYGIPFLYRLHRYLCAWIELLDGYCECVPAVTLCDCDTPSNSVNKTPLSRAMVLA